MKITPEMVNDRLEGIRKSDLDLITLKSFLEEYSSEICSYYGIDEWILLDEYQEIDSSILCLIDRSEAPTKKKISRKAGKDRRNKVKHRYSYENPLNRIHGFICIEDTYKSNQEGKKVAMISTICSSHFSGKRGVGFDLMNDTEAILKKCEYTDIILEVANEWAWRAAHNDESSGEESAEEESSDEESSDEESSGEEEEEEEDYDDLIDIVSHELWRKVVRIINNCPYYNINKDYIEEFVARYLYNIVAEPEIIETPEKGLIEENTSETISNDVKKQEPDEYSYGGYWYSKGKRSQEKLIQFYQKFGYVEDPKVHCEWGCFSDVPYPSYIKHIQ